jgi:hypothetical protein
MWHFECQWRCNTGYSEMNGTCSPLPVPRLIVLDPLPVLSESDVSLQPIRVRISRQPTSTVTVFAQNMDGQSNLTISTISFNPTGVYVCGHACASEISRECETMNLCVPVCQQTMNECLSDSSVLRLTASV